MSSPVEHLLAVTSFTQCSRFAIERAIERGNTLGAQVTLLHVIEEGLSRKRTSVRQREARGLLIDQMSSLGPNLGTSDVSINVRTGEPYVEIIREAIELGSDAIILGADGHGSAADSAGGTAINVVRGCVTPVILVGRRPDGPYGHSVIGVDRFTGSEPTVKLVRRLAPEAEAHIIEAFPAVTMDAGAAWTKSPSAKANPIGELISCIEQLGAELLALDSNRAFEHDVGLLDWFSTSLRCDLLLFRHQ